MKRIFLQVSFVLLITLLCAPVLVNAVPAQEKAGEKLILGAMRPGTTHYAASLAISQIINQHTDLKMIVQPYASAIAMMPAVQNGTVDISATTGGTMWAFVYNTPTIYLPKIKQACPDLRILMGGWNMYTAWVTRPDTEIKTIADLKGRKIFWKSRIGFENVITGEDTLRAYGLDPEKDVNGVVGYERSANALDALKRKEIDAAFVPVGGTKIKEVESATGVLLLPFPAEKLSFMRIKGMLDLTLSAGYLPGIESPTPVLTKPFFIYSHKNLPEQTAAIFVKTVVEHHEEAANVVLEARELGKEFALPSIQSIVSPYHSGAIKYFKEEGMWNAELEAHQKGLLEKLEQ